jgi:hypothetical protein
VDQDGNPLYGDVFGEHVSREGWAASCRLQPHALACAASSCNASRLLGLVSTSRSQPCDSRHRVE